MEGETRIFKNFGGNIKCIPYVIGTLDREEREDRVEEIFEVIMADDNPKLMVDNKILILEDQRPSGI